MEPRRFEATQALDLDRRATRTTAAVLLTPAPVDHRFQLDAGLEVRDALRRPAHPVAGPRVASQVWPAAPEAEAAEAAQLSVLAPAQRLHDAAEHGFDDDCARVLVRSAARATSSTSVAFVKPS